jgi:putative intracellular protease/amidase
MPCTAALVVRGWFLYKYQQNKNGGYFKMGKVLCFIYNEMADFEMTLATHLLGMSEKEIVLIAYEKEVITSKPGVTYYPRLTVNEALLLNDIEGLIIPGGWVRDLKPELKELICKLDTEKKLIAAICAGPEYLAKAGILDNHKYTTTLSEEYLKQIGIEDVFPRNNYIKEKVVRDENLITAVGHSFVDFAIEVTDWFGLFDDEEQKERFRNSYKGL